MSKNPNYKKTPRALEILGAPFITRPGHFIDPELVVEAVRQSDVEGLVGPMIVVGADEIFVGALVYIDLKHCEQFSKMRGAEDSTKSIPAKPKTTYQRYRAMAESCLIHNAIIHILQCANKLLAPAKAIERIQIVLIDPEGGYLNLDGTLNRTRVLTELWDVREAVFDSSLAYHDAPETIFISR